MSYSVSEEKIGLVAEKNCRKKIFFSHNCLHKNKIHKVLCPGLGTATGRVPLHEAARQMALAYRNFHHPTTNKTLNSKEEYLKELIKGHRSHANKNKNSNGLFVQYPEFIEHCEKILNHFNLTANAKEKQDMTMTLQYDSKSMQKKLWECKFLREQGIYIPCSLKNGLIE